MSTVGWISLSPVWTDHYGREVLFETCVTRKFVDDDDDDDDDGDD